MKPIIVPAVIARNQTELDTIIRHIGDAADRIMLDIMDGIFVASQSLNFDFRIKKGPEYEAHLMVVTPKEWLRKLYGKVYRVIVHVETIENLQDILNQAKVYGYKLYIAFNPETKIELLKPMIDHIDGILIMTVNPGMYGSQFIPETLKKIEKIRSWNADIPIEVDGGMTPETSKIAREAGANIIASGSYIIKNKDARQAIAQLQTE